MRKEDCFTMMMGMPVIEFDDMAQSALSELSNMLTANAATSFAEMGISGVPFLRLPYYMGKRYR